MDVAGGSGPHTEQQEKTKTKNIQRRGSRKLNLLKPNRRLGGYFRGGYKVKVSLAIRNIGFLPIPGPYVVGSQRNHTQSIAFLGKLARRKLANKVETKAC